MASYIGGLEMYCRRHKIKTCENSYCSEIFLKYHIIEDQSILKNNIFICDNCIWGNKNEMV